MEKNSASPSLPNQQPAATTQTKPVSPAIQKPPTKSAAGNVKNCDNCMKPSSPFRKEITSLLLLVFIALTTILGVLFVNEKRTSADLSKQSMDKASEVMAEAAEPTPFPDTTPAPKDYIRTVSLPEPSLSSNVSVEQTLASRRSRREFAEEPVTMAELSQILWAGQGITETEAGHRTAPSARALYPFTLYVVVRNVADLDPGLYEYFPDENSLGQIRVEDAGQALIDAEVQEHSQVAPVVILFSAAYGKVVPSFPDPKPVSLMEAGHISENIYLQVEALGMSTVTSAGFDAQKVGQGLNLDPSEEVVYMMPVGHRAPEVTEE